MGAIQYQFRRGTRFMNLKNRRQLGFTLVEVLIVVVIMAILAATIIPQFSDSAKDSKMSSAKFNLHTIRAQIELYKSQHDGKMPSNTLAELTQLTDVNGTVGTGAAFIYGPYLRSIPVNPLSKSATIVTATTDPPGAADSTAGYILSTNTGKLYLNDNNPVACADQ